MPSSKPRCALLLIGLGLLASCAAGSSEPSTNACQAVTLQTYTKAEQARVADEMDAAPAGATWPGWITDYGRLRSGVRACRGVRP